MYRIIACFIKEIATKLGNVQYHTIARVLGIYRQFAPHFVSVVVTRNN
jgi:hypothetical protein